MKRFPTQGFEGNGTVDKAIRAWSATLDQYGDAQARDFLTSKIANLEAIDVEKAPAGFNAIDASRGILHLHNWVASIDARLQQVAA